MGPEAAPRWIQDVRWPSATVSVNVTRQAVKDAPPYDSEAPLSLVQETVLDEHYGRPGDRAAEVKRDAALSNH